MTETSTETTDFMTEDQETFLRQWKTLKSMKCRTEMNKALVGIIHGLQLKPPDQLSSYEKGLLSVFESECIHQQHVNRVLQKVGLYRCHDWSKDYYMFFILAGVHHFKVTGHEFDAERDTEYNQHFENEPHHPEFEKTGGVINVLDIQEMAVDRLSRSLFRNNGEVSTEDMAKYAPAFYGDKPEEKLALFYRFVNDFMDLAMQVYHEIVREIAHAKAVKAMWHVDSLHHKLSKK